MTVAYGDTCPACHSTDVLPYAVILGGSEEYGYHCQDCGVTWPVLASGVSVPAFSVPAAAGVSLRYRALRESTAGNREGPEGERLPAGIRARSCSPSPSSPATTRTVAASRI